MLFLFWSIYFGRSLRMMVLADQSTMPQLSEIAPSALVFVGVMIAIMTAMGLYERNFWSGRGDMLLRIGVSFLVGLFAMTLAYYLFPELSLGRGEFSLAFGIAFFGILLLRFMFFEVSDREVLKRRVLVLGVGHNAKCIEELQRIAKTSFLVTGYVQLHEDEQLNVPVSNLLHVPGHLFDLAESLHVDEIVVALDDQRKGFPIDQVLECKIQGFRISSFLHFYERETGKIQLDALRPSNLIFADGFRRALMKETVKRLFDITVSLALLALAWPLMLGAALAIWIESGFRGPIFYRQTRVGLNDGLFEVIKFRSMRTDAEKDGIARWAQANDSRITRVGAVLRDTRIDELPQLFDVLRGDMSFVGPRPERPQFVAELSKKIPFYSMRHMVKPGITGWAQICYPYGASEKDAREKLQYDMYYIKNYSFFFDILILLQTVHTVLWGRGAH
ncbi:MAG TPA: TIGR03013 family PEP-CTERM/XrtA system glycosyltransferase [Candidatus Competibacteraceae bacterium]|nr:TIGR03013 family PEP-CTERM/XrtA system glycosyltransferase [Candidatus Competibacteraceae bacterium]HRY19435.1 TIGR03013 family PEP-CTERM/XrtA system glycosyltransferase [Candidatus Competibacteraceae bacterium]